MARELGAEAVDIALFAGRSHLDIQQVFSDVPRAAKRVNMRLVPTACALPTPLASPAGFLKRMP